MAPLISDLLMPVAENRGRSLIPAMLDEGWPMSCRNVALTPDSCSQNIAHGFTLCENPPFTNVQIIMKPEAFDRSKHVYRNEQFAELVKDAVRFFHGTPVRELPLRDAFKGTGVYALYYTGSNPLYAKYAKLNRLSYSYPIYVGKAVPKGWRQARVSDGEGNQANELLSRIRQHSRGISLGEGLELHDFSCRFVIFEADGSDMISTVEAALIKITRPLWNTALDGFGNHDPGKGRYEQARSDWDVMHPGRKWADKCNGMPKSQSTILKNIEQHLRSIGDDLALS